jgi:hypothetical protein
VLEVVNAAFNVANSYRVEDRDSEGSDSRHVGRAVTESHSGAILSESEIKRIVKFVFNVPVRSV